MLATAIIMAVVFGAIYLVVKGTVYRHLDNDLSYEAGKHSGKIKIIKDSIQFMNKAEWEEREHLEIQVNPVFIQLMDKQGTVMDKSPNLKGDFLPFKESGFGGHFDAKLNERPIRQVQLPIEQEGKIGAGNMAKAGYSITRSYFHFWAMQKVYFAKHISISVIKLIPGPSGKTAITCHIMAWFFGACHGQDKRYDGMPYGVNSKWVGLWKGRRVFTELCLSKKCH